MRSGALSGPDLGEAVGPVAASARVTAQGAGLAAGSPWVCPLTGASPSLCVNRPSADSFWKELGCLGSGVVGHSAQAANGVA